MSKASNNKLLKWTSKAKQFKLKHTTHASKAKKENKKEVT